MSPRLHISPLLVTLSTAVASYGCSTPPLVQPHPLPAYVVDILTYGSFSGDTNTAERFLGTYCFQPHHGSRPTQESGIPERPILAHQLGKQLSLDGITAVTINNPPHGAEYTGVYQHSAEFTGYPALVTFGLTHNVLYRVSMKCVATVSAHFSNRNQLGDPLLGAMSNALKSKAIVAPPDHDCHLVRTVTLYSFEFIAITATGGELGWHIGRVSESASAEERRKFTVACFEVSAIDLTAQ